MNAQNPFSQLGRDYQASLNNAYRDAQNLSTGMRSLPEGKYQCIICAFSLRPSKQYPDELSLSLGFQVISGDQKNVIVYKYYAINPENLDRLKTDMETLKIDLHDDITNLGEADTAEAIIDQIVDITVKHKAKTDGKGFFQNIYINRAYGKNSFTEIEDDDNPFD